MRSPDSTPCLPFGPACSLPFLCLCAQFVRNREPLSERITGYLVNGGGAAAIGSYLAHPLTWLHRLDPRVKQVRPSGPSTVCSLLWNPQTAMGPTPRPLRQPGEGLLLQSPLKPTPKIPNQDPTPQVLLHTSEQAVLDPSQVPSAP